MFQKARETAYLESTTLLFLLLRWWKPLVIVTLFAALASLIFSGPSFIIPKFKSSVVFFPAASNSVSKALLQNIPGLEKDILAFGAEEESEQLLQILHSDEIRDKIIQKYDLINHYNIDRSKSFPQTRLIECFKKNISFSRTEFMSVRIDVLDHNPAVAASIANDISALLDTVKTKMQHARAASALQIVERAYHDMLSDISKSEDSLMQLRRMGVLDYKNQSNILGEEYAKAHSMYESEKASLTVLVKYVNENDTSIINTKARIEGAAARVKTLEKQLRQLAEYGGASVSLNEVLSLKRTELSALQEQYNRLKIDATQNIPHTFIVNKAVESERKSYPVRWIIVLITSFSAFFLALTVLLIHDKIKQIDYK